MEEFKRLKWSWYKYEAEKNYLERNFSFETINDNDALARNLNEIHTCVIPEQSEFRIFKTSEEIVANRLVHHTNSGEVVQLRDPRINKYSKLQDSSDLIKEYSYTSELKKHEHLKILGFLGTQAVHNPKIIKNTKIINSTVELPKGLEEKLKKEAEHFQRCAEIYYHRHITQNNDLLCTQLKELLIDKWKKLEAQFPYTNYQAITMIVRNQSNKSSNVLGLIHIEDLPNDLDKKLHTVPDNLFINLQNPCMDSIKLFLQSREISTKDTITNSDIYISLDILTKLFVDGTEFNTSFINESNCTKFLLNEVVPLKTIAQSDALEEAVKLNLKFNFEWHNASKCVQSKSNSQNIDFRIHSINETMSNVFKRYKKHAGANNEISLWKLENGSQNLLISVSNNNCYYFNDHTKVIISIKFEHQTIFGAEQMTREELLKEWIQVKFSRDSVVLRFRIDAKSLEILSVITLKIGDIEKDLKELHNYDPLEALDILFNVFHCIHNLPDSRYMIQAQRNEKDCNKLLIYKENHEHGKSLLTNEDFKVSETFTRKWMPIDKRVLTFVHVNEEIAPCCFSYKSSQKISYIMPKSNKTLKAPVNVQKSPKKQQTLRKRIKRNNKKKKNAMAVKNVK